MANDCWGPRPDMPGYHPPKGGAGLGDASRDRGEFGMPGIGAGKIFMTDQPNRKVWSMPDYKMVISESEISVDYGENGFNIPAVTDEARYILAKILPNLLMRFLQKNQKYARAQIGHDLGVKGVIPDINRKTSVLIDRLWHGGHEVDEGTEEVIDDLIGHLLLIKAKIGIGHE